MRAQELEIGEMDVPRNFPGNLQEGRLHLDYVMSKVPSSSEISVVVLDLIF